VVQTARRTTVSHLAAGVAVALGVEVDELGQREAGRVVGDEAGRARVPGNERGDDAKCAGGAEERRAGRVVGQAEEEEELILRLGRGEARRGDGVGKGGRESAQRSSPGVGSASAAGAPQNKKSGLTKSTRTQKIRSPPELRNAQNVKTRAVMSHEKKTGWGEMESQRSVGASGRASAEHRGGDWVAHTVRWPGRAGRSSRSPRLC